MEKMPYRAGMDTALMQLATETVLVQPASDAVVSSDWRQGLPTLRGEQVVLRELRASDAASLFALERSQHFRITHIDPAPFDAQACQRMMRGNQSSDGVGQFVFAARRFFQLARELKQ